MSVQVYDPSGNPWALTVDTDGALVATQVAAGSPPVYTSTISLNDVVSWARTQSRLIPLIGVGGVANEPALSIAKDWPGKPKLQ